MQKLSKFEALFRCCLFVLNFSTPFLEFVLFYDENISEIVGTGPKSIIHKFKVHKIFIIQYLILLNIQNLDVIRVEYMYREMNL